jgi:hypothetical protein
VTDDPYEALRNLAEDPFTDLRDAAEVLPLVLAALSREADDICSDPEYPVGEVLPLAKRIDQTFRYVRALASNTPPRPATPAVPPPEPWEWRWPDELRVGEQFRFAGRGERGRAWATVATISPSGPDGSRRVWNVEGQTWSISGRERIQVRACPAEADS